jgi:hypothetical protein
MPQGKVIFRVSGAPHRPIVPKRQLRLAYTGPAIVKTPADVLAIIRQRTADVLTEAEIALVVRPLAIEGPPKPQPAEPVRPEPKTKPAKRKARPPARSRDAGGRFVPRQG